MAKFGLSLLMFVSFLFQPLLANRYIPIKYSINSLYTFEFKHPVHISFTNIEYMPGKGKFIVLFKFFIDDFNEILNIKYGKNLVLANDYWEKNYPETINLYILEHFKFKIGDKDKTKTSMKFIRKEVSEDSIWLYYDFNTNDKNSNFEIQNSLLTDLYPDQNNLLVFTYLGKQKAVKFNQTKIKEVFSF